MALFNGTAENDSLVGSIGNDTLNGLAGDDTLDGGEGADFLYGGDGNDVFIYDAADITVAGQAGTDTWDASAQTAGLNINLTPYATMENFTGGSGGDGISGNGLDNVLIGGAGSNTLSGGSGNDTIVGGAGADFLYGGDGNDVFIYDAADITVAGQAGTDTWDASAQTAGLNINLTPYATMENFTAGSGNDMLTGNANANVITGGSGDDTLDGGTGSDFLYGGDGNDVFIYDAADITVAGQAGVDTWDASAQTAGLNINLTPYATMENFTAGSGNDMLTGNANANVITGGSGNDTLDGGEGADFLYGGDGNDVFIYDAADITVAGQAGTDTWDASAQTTGLNINLAPYLTMENVTGGSGSDTLTGNASANVIMGGSGDDTLDGGAGADFLYGGDGNDVFIYDAADITVAGQAGTDTWDASAQTAGLNINLNPYATMENFTAGSGNDMLTGNANNNVIMGGSGNDTLAGGAGADNLYGGDGNDVFIYDAADITVAGQAGIDTWDASAQTAGLNINLTPYATMENFTAGSGNDRVTGNANSNVIIGGSGNDSLDGGAGDDVLAGGTGNDLLTGGSGSDTYIFNAESDNDTAVVDRQDTIYIRTNALSSNYAMQQSGNDFVFQMDGPGSNEWLTESLTVQNWMTDTASRAGWIKFDDLTVKVEGSGGSGNDTITAGNDANYWVEGYSGDDVLSGGAGNDFISDMGAASSDTLSGGAGNDVLFGGSGNDLLMGGSGADTYIFNAESDHDIAVVDREDIIFIRTNAFSSDFGMEQSGNDFVFQLDGTGTADWLTESLTVQNWMTNTANRAGWIEFNDLTVKVEGSGGSGNDTITAGNDANYWVEGYGGDDVLNGGAGNDFISDMGEGSSDTLNGGAGDDVLFGGTGVDTYSFSRITDWGHDTIKAAGGNAISYLPNSEDWVAFNGIGSGEVSASMDGSDLLLTLDSNDTVRIEKWGLGGYYQLNQFKFSDGNYALSSSGWQSLT